MDDELTETPCELCGWMQTVDGSCSNPTCEHHVVPETDADQPG